MDEIDWDNATPYEKLEWYNEMAKRPLSIGKYSKDILALANHFSQNPNKDSSDVG